VEGTETIKKKAEKSSKRGWKKGPGGGMSRTHKRRNKGAGGETKKLITTDPNRWGQGKNRKIPSKGEKTGRENII